MSQGSFSPKTRFLGQKVCSVARLQTDTHESEYRGHPFRVSGIFPSTYHQESVQQPIAEMLKGSHLDNTNTPWQQAPLAQQDDPPSATSAALHPAQTPCCGQTASMSNRNNDMHAVQYSADLIVCKEHFFITKFILFTRQQGILPSEIEGLLKAILNFFVLCYYFQHYDIILHCKIFGQQAK